MCVCVCQCVTWLMNTAVLMDVVCPETGCVMEITTVWIKVTSSTAVSFWLASG